MGYRHHLSYILIRIACSKTFPQLPEKDSNLRWLSQSQLSCQARRSGIGSGNTLPGRAPLGRSLSCRPLK